MKKAVSESGVVFGRSVCVEDGGRGAQKFANPVIEARTSGKAQRMAGAVLFTILFLDKPKKLKTKINL